MPAHVRGQTRCGSVGDVMGTIASFTSVLTTARSSLSPYIVCGNISYGFPFVSDKSGYVVNARSKCDKMVPTAIQDGQRVSFMNAIFYKKQNFSVGRLITLSDSHRQVARCQYIVQDAALPHVIGSQRAEIPGCRSFAKNEEVKRNIFDHTTPQVAHHSNRRAVLASLPLLTIASFPSLSIADVAPPDGAAGAAKSLTTLETRPQSPPVSLQSFPPEQRSMPSFGQKEILYPEWLAGSWNVSAKFAGFSTPLGRAYLTPSVAGAKKASCLLLADAGASPTYQTRYLTRLEGGGAVGDPVFNMEECVDGYLGAGAVKAISYESSHWSILYQLPRRSSPGADTWRAELFAIGQKSGPANQGTDFSCSQRFRQVSNGAGQTLAHDYNVTWRYRYRDPFTVSVLQQVEGFLQPQDAAFFETRGKAVVLYDYTLEMHKIE